MVENKIPITVAKGDGIGPEIMEATLRILDASGAAVEIHPVEIGEQVYLQGEPTGIHEKTWETIRNTEAFLKAPITTPQGGGFKSLNVTVRTSLNLYANVRPCISYFPYVETKHPNMDVVIVRENEEGLYTGIEYRQTLTTYHALKLNSRPGAEKIIRFAFEYAKSNGRKKVTCFTKDNILKLTDGLFHTIFDEIASEYPEIENEHWIVDIGSAKLADTPEAFDVVVLPNLYGDILSDIAAQITGSVGLAGSANIGERGAMFEAIHGSAPRRAGQNLANPSGLILASIMMLVHIGQGSAASKIHNAWLKTLEEGIHTYDIFDEQKSCQKVGTKEFADAVIERLGKEPDTLEAKHYGSKAQRKETFAPLPKGASLVKKELVGVDIYIDSTDTLDQLQPRLSNFSREPLTLKMVSNRGVTVWPHPMPETFCIDQWRFRFIADKGISVTHQEIIALLASLAKEGIDFIKTEHLYTYDGEPGFTVSQYEQ